MDSGTLITGIIFILICILPIVVLNILSRRRDKKILRSLSEFNEKENYKVSQHDVWNNSAIGIDDIANIVFFTNVLKGEQNMKEIPLIEIQKTRVVKTSKTGSNLDITINGIEKLELVFVFKDKKRDDIVIEFYNAKSGSSTLSGELILINKWCKITNDKIEILTKNE